MDIAWVLLVVSGLMEPLWLYTLKRSDDFKDLGWTAATVAVIIADLYILSVAMRTVGAGMSYAVWTGIGAIGAVIMGALIFKERVSILKAMFVMIIIAGIVGLNMTAGAA